VGTMPIDQDEAHMPAVPGSRQQELVIGSAGLMARTIPDIKLGFEVMRDHDDMEWKEADVEKALGSYRVSVVDGFGPFKADSATLHAFETLRSRLGQKGTKIDVKGFGLPDENYLRAWQSWGQIFGHFAAQGFPQNSIGRFLRRREQKKFRKTYGNNVFVD